MTYRSQACKALRLLELTERLQSTNGGERETALNELTVRPTGSPSLRHAVMMVTPVGNRPSVRRKWVESKSGGAAVIGVWFVSSMRMTSSPTTTCARRGKNPHFLECTVSHERTNSACQGSGTPGPHALDQVAEAGVVNAHFLERNMGLLDIIKAGTIFAMRP